MNDVVILYPTRVIHTELKRVISCDNIVQIVVHYTPNHVLIHLIESFHRMSRIREQCESILCQKFKCCHAVLLCSPHFHVERDRFVHILHHMGVRNCWNAVIQNHPSVRNVTTIQIYGECLTFKLSPFNDLLDPPKIPMWCGQSKTTDLCTLMNEYISLFRKVSDQMRIYTSDSTKKELDKYVQDVQTNWQTMRVTL